jgi:hypothetical protein
VADAGEIARLEEKLEEVMAELRRVEARISDRPGPIETRRLETKKSELEGETVSLRNQIRLAGEKPPPDF